MRRTIIQIREQSPAPEPARDHQSYIYCQRPLPPPAVEDATNEHHQTKKRHRHPSATPQTATTGEDSSYQTRKVRLSSYDHYCLSSTASWLGHLIRMTPCGYMWLSNVYTDNTHRLLALKQALNFIETPWVSCHPYARGAALILEKEIRRVEEIVWSESRKDKQVKETGAKAEHKRRSESKVTIRRYKAIRA